MRCRIGAAACDHRNPAAGDLHRGGDDVAMFLRAKSRDLARRPARDERVAALIDLPGDEITEYRFIDSSRRKRGHEGGYRTEKHG